MDFRLTSSISMTLQKVKPKVYARYVLTTERKKIKSRNALLTIGREDWARATTVIVHFSYTLISAGGRLQKRMLSPNPSCWKNLELKLNNGLPREVLTNKHLKNLKLLKAVNSCRKPAKKKT